MAFEPRTDPETGASYFIDTSTGEMSAAPTETSARPDYSGAGQYSQYFNAPSQFTNTRLYGPTGLTGQILKQAAIRAGKPDYDFNQAAAQVAPGFGWQLPGASGWLLGANEVQIAKSILNATGDPSFTSIANEITPQQIAAGAQTGSQRDVALQQQNAANKGNFFQEIAPIAMIAMSFIPGLNIAAAIGESMGLTGTLAAAAGNAVMSGGMSALGGGTPEEILKAAATGGATGAVGSEVGKLAGTDILGKGITGAATGATGAALTGRDIGKGALIGGVSAAGGEGIRQATATPPVYSGPQMGDIGSGAFPLNEQVVSGQQGVTPPNLPEDMPVYKDGKELTPAEVAKMYPEYYPGGVLPAEGQTTTFSPDKGFTGGSAALSSALNLLSSPTAAKSYSLGIGGQMPTSAATSAPAATPVSDALGGELQSTETGGKRKNVWNLSSLRNLQDALGV